MGCHMYRYFVQKSVNKMYYKVLIVTNVRKLCFAYIKTSIKNIYVK